MAWPDTVRKSDLKITTYRGSGPGGQNRNKRDTCVRMKHLPTGVTVTAEEARTQGKNKELAFRRLAALLVPMMKMASEDRPERTISTEVVRTYRATDNLVRDKRLAASRYDYGRVLDGDDLGFIIKDLLQLDREQSAAAAPPGAEDPAA